MPLLERVRVEVYLPDVLSFEFQHLLQFLEEELTYTFGGTTIVRGESGERIPDRINLLYSDALLALSTDFVSIAAFVRELKSAVLEALPEEAVLMSVRTGLSHDLSRPEPPLNFALVLTRCLTVPNSERRVFKPPRTGVVSDRWSN